MLAEDAALLHAWLEDPAFAAYRPYLRQLCPTPADLLQRKAMLNQITPPVEIELTVLHRPSATPIGAMSLSGIDHFNRKAEFSFGFARGRGTRCVTEALHFALDSAFASLGLNKLIFYVAEQNLAMLAGMEQYRFVEEGLLREELLLEQGGYVNLLRFALFRADWEQGTLRQRLIKTSPLAS